MNLKVCPTTTDDRLIYEECFINNEFNNLVFGGEKVSVSRYMRDEVNAEKFIVFQYKDSKYIPIAFAHFYEEHNDGQKTIVGGINPKLFNSGIGIYCTYAVLKHIFRIHPSCSVLTGVFPHNNRTIKLIESFGFITKNSINNKFIYYLTHDDFIKSTMFRAITNRITVEY